MSTFGMDITEGTVSFYQPKQIDDSHVLDRCPTKIGKKIDFNRGDHVFNMTVTNIVEDSSGWQITMEYKK